jgi:putative two-component system response regulator
MEDAMADETTDQTMKWRILLIDDSPSSLQMLAEILLQQGYEVFPFAGGREALKEAENLHPDLILLDVVMPEMDGFEVCQALKKRDAMLDVPVIFLSALNKPEEIVRGFAVGGVDYVTKPYQVSEIKARVEAHLKIRGLQLELESHNRRLEDLVQEKVRELTASQMSTIFALAKLAEARDDETGRHLERTQRYCRRLSVVLKEAPPFKDLIDDVFVETIYHASPLHDIGKIGIPDKIVLKPGKLTGEEFEIMKTHTLIGAQTLEAVRTAHPRNGFLGMSIAIARCHHERWDGSGYPLGLFRESIPLPARILAVSDVYEILRSKRPYKEPLDHAEAVRIIGQGSGIQFDPYVVKAFLDVEEEFRVLRLETER